MEIIKPDIKKAIKAIKQGKVLVCPTDTVYGLVCDFANKKAVEKLCKIKKRPGWKPIPVFVKDIKMAKKIAKINLEQEGFLKKVWPGGITVILKPKRKFPEGIGKPKKEIGLRIPNYEFVLNLVKRIGPLAESSANISGEPASGNIKKVIKYFTLSRVEGQPDLVIDAGNLPKAKPSKVIDLTVRLYRTLRP